MISIENIAFKHIDSDWKIEEKSLFKVQYGEGYYNATTNIVKINDVPVPKELTIKIVKTSREKNITLNECERIDQLLGKEGYSKSLIKYYGYGVNQVTNDIYIYMERLDGYKNIYNLLREENYKFTENEISIIVKGLLNALVFIHGQNIAHLNIKSNNLLYNPTTGDVKLINLELSIIGSRVVDGTAGYKPPEVENQKPECKSDLWCMGRTLINMVHGSYKPSGEFEIPSQYSILLRRFIQKCLLIIDKRPQARDLDMDFFLKGVNSIQSPIINSDPGSSYTLNPFNQVSISSIPSSATEVILPEFNEEFEIGLRLPPSVKRLQLLQFNNPLTHGNNMNSIGESVTDLDLPSFNQKFERDSLPGGVVYLKMPIFNQVINESSLPSSLTSLSLDSYNGEIFQLPLSVKYLSLSSFNNQLAGGSLPASLIKLQLSSFNQNIIPKAMPQSIESLILPKFNKELKLGCLPSSLKTLVLSSYNIKIEKIEKDNVIPISVKELILSSYSFDLDISKHNNIEVLELGSFDFNIQGGDLPDSITQLSSTYRFENRYSLYLNNYTKRPHVLELSLLNYNEIIGQNVLPPNLLSLTLGSSFKEFDSLANLPTSLMDLTFGIDSHDSSTKQTIIKSIPVHVTNVNVFYNNSLYYQSIEGMENKVKSQYYSYANQDSPKQKESINQNISLGFINDSASINQFIGSLKLKATFNHNKFSLSNNINTINWDLKDAKIIPTTNQVIQFKNTTYNPIDCSAHQDLIYSASDISSLKSIIINNDYLAAYVHYLVPKFEIKIETEHIKLDNKFLKLLKEGCSNIELLRQLTRDKTHFATKFVIGGKISQSYSSNKIKSINEKQLIASTLANHFIKTFKDYLGSNMMYTDQNKIIKNHKFKFSQKEILGGNENFKLIDNLEKFILSLNNIYNCTLVEVGEIKSIWDILKTQDIDLYGKCTNMLLNSKGNRFQIEVSSLNQVVNNNITGHSIFKINGFDNSSLCKPGFNVAVFNPIDLKLRVDTFTDQRVGALTFKLSNYLESIDDNSIILFSTYGFCYSKSKLGKRSKDALKKLGVDTNRFGENVTYSAIVKKGAQDSDIVQESGENRVVTCTKTYTI